VRPVKHSAYTVSYLISDLRFAVIPQVGIAYRVKSYGVAEDEDYHRSSLVSQVVFDFIDRLLYTTCTQERKEEILKTTMLRFNKSLEQSVGVRLPELDSWSKGRLEHLVSQINSSMLGNSWVYSNISPAFVESYMPYSLGTPLTRDTTRTDFQQLLHEQHGFLVENPFGVAIMGICDDLAMLLTLEEHLLGETLPHVEALHA